MAILQLLQTLKARLAETAQDRAQAQNFPSGYEPGMRHPHTGGHMLLRDDGVAELTAGPGATVTADGPARMVGITAAGVAIEAEHLHLHTPPGGLYFGYQAFHADWLAGRYDSLLPPPAGQRWLWRNAPLVQRYPAALQAFEALPLVGGAPGAGQIPISLAGFFETQPLFGPNEELRILSTHLGELLRHLAEVDPHAG